VAEKWAIDVRRIAFENHVAERDRSLYPALRI
jgi:hypothetical protein